MSLNPAILERLYGRSQDAQDLAGTYQGTPGTVAHLAWLMEQLLLELRTGVHSGYPVILTLSNTAQDYTLAGPSGAKSATLYVHNPNSSPPTNDVMAYFSGGIGWPEPGGGGVETSGLAYNARSGYNGGYVGAPLRPDEVSTIDLSAGGGVHVATPVAGAIAVAGFYK